MTRAVGDDAGLPPGLSMLWEQDVDASAALASRFGLADLGDASTWLRSVLRRTWGLRAGRCTRLVVSDRNAVAWVDTERGPLVVKWSCDVGRFARLAASTRLLQTLAEHGLPAAVPHLTRDGDARAEVAGPVGPLSVAVVPELGGTWLDIGDLAAVFAAGACLARVHEALAAAPADVVEVLSPPQSPPALDLTLHIARWLDASDRGWAPRASARLRSLLTALPRADELAALDPPQLVHHDYRAANLLVEGSRVVGVLDLDDAAVGHRTADLAKAATYLATRFVRWAPTPAAAQRALLAGYASRRPPSPTEAAWYEALVLWHGLAAVPGEHDPAGWAAALRQDEPR